MDKTRYYSLNQYLKNTFGEKVYKISIDGGMTCPNRDGTKSCLGCTFCADGSGQFTVCGEDIFQAIEDGKMQSAKKSDCKKFIAYFQRHTNTYAPIEYLSELFNKAISHPDIVALSIATRPDCLYDEVIALLNRLNKIKPIWVELGLQTSNEKTADLINRCYENSVYIEAVKKLKDIGINVITHMIIGLPGESFNDYLNTVKFICNNNSDGIKLQLLHVLKGTVMYEDYCRGKFKCLEKDEYVNTLCELIQYIPKNIVIHRLTGDGDKKLLVAPLWSINKKDVLNSINRCMATKNIYQGELIE